MRTLHAIPSTPGRRRVSPLPLLLVTALALASGEGCRRRAPDQAGGMSDSSFVATMVELRRLDTALTADSAARATMRTSVLERRRVTLVELERAATALAGDPDHAARVFARIDSIVARRDTVSRALPPNVAPPGARPVGAPGRRTPAPGTTRPQATNAAPARSPAKTQPAPR